MHGGAGLADSASDAGLDVSGPADRPAQSGPPARPPGRAFFLWPAAATHVHHPPRCTEAPRAGLASDLRTEAPLAAAATADRETAYWPAGAGGGVLVEVRADHVPPGAAVAVLRVHPRHVPAAGRGPRRSASAAACLRLAAGPLTRRNRRSESTGCGPWSSPGVGPGS